MGKRELIALLNLSSWCLVMVERLFLAVPRGCLQFVIVVFPDHTHLLFLTSGNIIFLLFMQIQFWLSCSSFFILYFIPQPASSALSSSRKDIKTTSLLANNVKCRKKCIQ